MKTPSLPRRHWLFAGLLVPAAALRGVVTAAYYPALIFPDSVRYLQYARNFAAGHLTVDSQRQSGYSLLLVLMHNVLWLVAPVQHLAGLAIGAGVYAVLVRLGTRTWVAALAAIPVLFDPLELILEEYVLTEVWTLLLILAALALLVWRRAGPGWRQVAGAGALLGVAVTFRDQSLIMILPAAIFVLIAIRPRREALRRAAALAAAFAIPVVAYLGWFDASHGRWNFTTFSGAFLYGRVADFADCRGLALPAYERPLCPAQPPAERSADFYTWNPASPQWTFGVPAGMSRDAVVLDFSKRVLLHQPLAYAAAVGHDLLYSFSPVRGAGPEHYPPAYLTFRGYLKPDRAADASLRAMGYPVPVARPGPAGFLAGYGRWFYVPGPLLAAGLLAGSVACLRRKSPLAPACLLFTLGTIAIAIPSAVFATFDWRYQLPQLALIPVAAVLGGRVLLTRSPARSAPRPGVAADDRTEPEASAPAPPGAAGGA